MFDVVLPVVQYLDYLLLWAMTDALYALNDILLGAARITLVLRAYLGGVAGAELIGALLHQISPLWVAGMVAGTMALALWAMGRWFFSGTLTSLERVFFVTLLAGYLTSYGAIAVQNYQALRHVFGTLFYDAAYHATQAGLGVSGGMAVEPDCALSADDPEQGLCSGYELALSYLLFQHDAAGEGGIFTMRMPPFAQGAYFPVAAEVLLALPPASRQVILSRAHEAPPRVLTALPLSAMALMEELVRLGLTLATLGLFAGLGVALVFGAVRLPSGDMLGAGLERLVQMLVVTAEIELVLGLGAGVLWLTRDNAVLMAGAGILVLCVDTALAWQVLGLIVRSLEQGTGRGQGAFGNGTVVHAPVGAVAQDAAHTVRNASVLTVEGTQAVGRAVEYGAGIAVGGSMLAAQAAVRRLRASDASSAEVFAPDAPVAVHTGSMVGNAPWRARLNPGLDRPQEAPDGVGGGAGALGGEPADSSQAATADAEDMWVGPVSGARPSRAQGRAEDGGAGSSVGESAAGPHPRVPLRAAGTPDTAGWAPAGGAAAGCAATQVPVQVKHPADVPERAGQVAAGRTPAEIARDLGAKRGAGDAQDTTEETSEA